MGVKMTKRMYYQLFDEYRRRNAQKVFNPGVGDGLDGLDVIRRALLERIEESAENIALVARIRGFFLTQGRAEKYRATVERKLERLTGLAKKVAEKELIIESDYTDTFCEPMVFGFSVFRLLGVLYIVVVDYIAYKVIVWLFFR